ncbi:UNVERIFIED_CONTAM: hypothetical protein RKD43_007140 [Streptomyces graminofaciens]
MPRSTWSWTRSRLSSRRRERRAGAVAAVCAARWAKAWKTVANPAPWCARLARSRTSSATTAATAAGTTASREARRARFNSRCRRDCSTSMNPPSAGPAPCTASPVSVVPGVSGAGGVSCGVVAVSGAGAVSCGVVGVVAAGAVSCGVVGVVAARWRSRSAGMRLVPAAGMEGRVASSMPRRRAWARVRGGMRRVPAGCGRPGTPCADAPAAGSAAGPDPAPDADADAVRVGGAGCAGAGVMRATGAPIATVSPSATSQVSRVPAVGDSISTAALSCSIS